MKFKISKAGKFYWKPERCGHKRSMGQFTYDSQINNCNAYQVQHYWVETCVQWFWLWWIFSIDNEPSKKGMGSPIKYVEYQEPKELKHLEKYQTN